MDREERDRGIVVEDLLGAVAVVDVPVDDQDPVEPEPLDGVRRGDGDAAEQAEAHRLVGPGVVAGRPDRAEGPAIGPLDDRRDRIDRRARREPRREGRAGRDPGVDLDLPAASRGEGVDCRDVAGRVDPEQLLVGRRPDRLGSGNRRAIPVRSRCRSTARSRSGRSGWVGLGT